MKLKHLLGASALAALPMAAATAQDAGAAALRELRRQHDDLVLGRRLPGDAAEGLCPALRGRDRRQHRLGRKLRRGGGEAPRPERGRQRHLGPRRRARHGRDPALRRGAGDGGPLRRVARPGARRHRRRARISARTSSRTATSRRTSIRRPSATAPTSPSGTASVPEDICAIFDLENFPGKRALEKRPINNLEWALICSGVPADQVYDTLETEEGVQTGARQARHHQGPDRLVVGRRRDAAAPRRRRGGDRLDLQRPPVLGDRGAEAAGRHALGLRGPRHRRLRGSGRPARGPAEPGEAFPPLRDRHPAPRRPGEVHLLRSGPRLLAAAGLDPCRSRHRHGAAHADVAGERRDRLPLQLRMVGRSTATSSTRASSPGWRSTTWTHAPGRGLGQPGPPSRAIRRPDRTIIASRGPRRR